MLTLVLVFIGSLSISFGQSNECINCSIYNDNCRVKTTGWRAFKLSEKDQLLVVKIPENTAENGYEIVFDENLDNCVNPGYAITGTLETFVCFWSPDLGCQSVAGSEIVNKYHMHLVACSVCARYCNCHIPSGAWLKRLSPLLKLTVGLSLVALLSLKCQFG